MTLLNSTSTSRAATIGNRCGVGTNLGQLGGNPHLPFSVKRKMFSAPTLTAPAAPPDRANQPCPPMHLWSHPVASPEPLAYQPCMNTPLDQVACRRDLSHKVILLYKQWELHFKDYQQLVGRCKWALAEILQSMSLARSKSTSLELQHFSPNSAETDHQAKLSAVRQALDLYRCLYMAVQVSKQLVTQVLHGSAWDLLEMFAAQLQEYRDIWGHDLDRSELMCMRTADAMTAAGRQGAKAIEDQLAAVAAEVVEAKMQLEEAVEKLQASMPKSHGVLGKLARGGNESQQFTDTRLMKDVFQVQEAEAGAAAGAPAVCQSGGVAAHQLNEVAAAGAASPPAAPALPVPSGAAAAEVEALGAQVLQASAQARTMGEQWQLPAVEGDGGAQLRAEMTQEKLALCPEVIQEKLALAVATMGMLLLAVLAAATVDLPWL